jgi:hypothetical protein
MAEDGGYVFTLIRSYLCKYLMLNNLEARGFEPCFDGIRLRVSVDVPPEGSGGQAETGGLSWMAPDVITFVITISL